VVGLAIARALAMRGLEVLVLEAEDAIGTATSSRNSEVVHAGLYYPRDWLKTRLCVRGRHLLYEYCESRGIPCHRLGKVVIAVAEDEVIRLRHLMAQALRNGVPVEWLDEAAVRQREPAIRASAGIWSPESGIVDSHGLMVSLQGDLEAHGGFVVLKSPVTGGRVSRREDHVVCVEDAGDIRCRLLINAAGLGAQALARRLAGISEARIPPQLLVKGHYFYLSGPSPFRHLVYPMPGPHSAGIHVTPDIAGRARFGPDADVTDSLDYQFDERRRMVFVEDIRRYWPDVTPERLEEGYTGIRPQLRHGKGARPDYVIDGPADHGVGGLVNLYGIESPGLTASLAIGEWVAALLEGHRSSQAASA
jgi:L-2-hydroxyglutarate oxidase LhgO